MAMVGAAQAINIADLREMCRRRLPRMIFDYIDGGAEDEVTLRQSVSHFDAYQWTWRSLVDVSRIKTKTSIMNAPTRQPFFIAPMAAQRLYHPEQGELAVARAAQAAGVAYAVSTLAGYTLEEIAAAAPTIPKFVQVYVWKDRGIVREFLARAKAAGFTGCILTADTVVAGNRERDPRNGFSIPPKLTAKTVRQALARPAFLARLATSPKIAPANFKSIDAGGRSIMEVIDDLFDRTMTWKDAEWMAAEWGGPFAVKGLSRAEDARRAVDAGASAVWVSNHGGRQIDTSVPVIDLLPDIRKAVGNDVEVIADGGVRRGSHVLKLLARGASSVAIGRPILYGLGAGGEAGVARALDILGNDVVRLLSLLGATEISTLDPALLRSPK
jgi:L-lactate dehydrogenase (cytochrome)